MSPSKQGPRELSDNMPVFSTHQSINAKQQEVGIEWCTSKELRQGGRDQLFLDCHRKPYKGGNTGDKF